MNIPTDLVVQQYLMQEYYSVLQVFTGGSKEPESGRTAAVCIYTFKIKMAKRSFVSFYYWIISYHTSSTVDRRSSTRKNCDM